MISDKGEKIDKVIHLLFFNMSQQCVRVIFNNKHIIIKEWNQWFFLQLYKNGLIENNGLQLWSAPANSPFDKVRLTTQDIEVLYVKP